MDSEARKTGNCNAGFGLTILSYNLFRQHKKQLVRYGARFSRREAGTTVEANAGHSHHALRLWELFVMHRIAVIKLA
jgi:hypothetical protein